MEPGVWPTRWITSNAQSPTVIVSPSRSVRVTTGMPAASSACASEAAPVARVTSESACQWSGCWWGGGRAGGPGPLGERLPVVRVLVGGDHGAQPGRADQLEQPGGVVRRVD